jgi:hypothetical protein
MKIALYPLIGILYVSSLVFAAGSSNAEIAVSVAGVLASLGIGALYLGPILTILFRFFKLRPSSQCFRPLRLSLLLGIASLVGLSLAEFGQLTLLMEVTTTCVVLSSIALGGFSVSWTVMRLWSDKDL